VRKVTISILQFPPKKSEKKKNQIARERSTGRKIPKGQNRLLPKNPSQSGKKISTKGSVPENSSKNLGLEVAWKTREAKLASYLLFGGMRCG